MIKYESKINADISNYSYVKQASHCVDIITHALAVFAGYIEEYTNCDHDMFATDGFVLYELRWTRTFQNICALQ